MLDSTLDVCGVNPFLSEHTLGHKQSSYKKQHILYPEQQRAEFAKASHKINIFTNITTHMTQGEMTQKDKEVMKYLVDFHDKVKARESEAEKQIISGGFEKAIDVPSFKN